MTGDLTRALALQPAWDPGLADIAPLEMMTGASAGFWAVGVDVLVPLVIALVYFARAIRLGTQAREARRLEGDADGPPAPGKELYRGVVEVKGGPAVVVTVEQNGREVSNKGNWTTIWEESSRKVEARPFVLVMAGGQRLRCEPDARTKLIDELDVTTRIAHAKRRRQARLTHGEKAVVRGRIVEDAGRGGARGYRDPGREPVLRPGPDGMMITASSLASPLLGAAAQRLKWASWFLLMAAIGGCVSAPYLWSSVVGHVETGTLVEVGTRREKVKNGYTTVGTIRYTVGGDGREHRDTVPATYASRWYERGAPLPVRVAPGEVHIGTEPGVKAIHVIMDTIALAIATLFASLAIASSAAWYERRPLVESRRGRLGDDADGSTD